MKKRKNLFLEQNVVYQKGRIVLDSAKMIKYEKKGRPWKFPTINNDPQMLVPYRNLWPKQNLRC